MSLADTLDQSLKDAMRARDTTRLNVLRMLKAALKNTAIQQGTTTPPSDEEVIATIRKQIKQREDSIHGFQQAGRTELVEKEQTEIEILQTYLPQPLSEEALEALATKVIAATNATSRAQMGLVMKTLQTEVAGRADGRTLSSIVQRLLGS